MITSPRKNIAETQKDAGVYVHFPYCLQKCPYCDFNSHVPKRGESYAPYTEAVLRELDRRLPELTGKNIRSIFFGGGTPSLWSPEAIRAVIEKIGGAPEEITLEANPGAVERGKLGEFKSCGINRVSMGVQALDDKLLRQLGRIHDRKEALDALQIIQATEFASHSIDLIYAVPGQTLAAWQSTMAEIVSLATPHVSAYTLVYEPGTRMTEWRDKGALQAMSEDDEAAMFEATFETFARAGLAPYEVSNFAQPGHESVHNQLYWRSQEYLGVGAGAHSFTNGVRRAGVKAPAAYVAAWSRGALAPSPFEFEEHIEPLQHAHEQLLCGLRMRRGFDALRAEQTLGVPALQAAQKTASAHEEWCTFDGRFLQPTLAGLRVNNALVLAASEALDSVATRSADSASKRDNLVSQTIRIDAGPLPVTVEAKAEAAQGGRHGQ